MNTLKKVFMCEVGVLQQIVERQQHDVIDNRVKMKQIATLLRVPRAHHRYIAEYGTYDFIEKCEEIVGSHDYARLNKEAQERRQVARQNLTMDRLIK